MEETCVVERKELPDLVHSCTTDRNELGEEIVASYLYQVHLYHWLETNDFGRFLIDNDI